MAKTQIIYTALPYEITDKGLYRLSVVVSPRLTPESSKEKTLEFFPTFLNWPQEIEQAKLYVEIADMSDSAGKPIPLTVDHSIDAKLWTTIFNKQTPVDGFNFLDMSKVKLRSYSVNRINNFVQRYYARLAVESPLDLPRLLPWDNANPALKSMLEEAGIQKVSSESARQGGINRLFSPPYDDQYLDDANFVFRTAMERDLYQADRFYHRKKYSASEKQLRRPDFARTKKPQNEDAYDFHRMIAALADFPKLMRPLALTLDFVFEAVSIRPDGKLRFRIDWEKKLTEINEVTPWTRFAATGKRFYTLPRADSEQNAGLLRLDNANDIYDDAIIPKRNKLFDIYQVDPDGAALKTVNFTIVAQNLVYNSVPSSTTSPFGGITYTTGDQQGLASLRSGGLGVSQCKRAEKVAKDAEQIRKNDKTLNNDEGNSILLYADDVFRGYRVDVADVTKDDSRNVWRTLCARVGDYRLVNDPKREFEISKDKDKDDEGYISGPSTSSEEADSNVHYLHESIFRWTGWSLCVPRPGLVLQQGEVQGSYIQTETPSEVKETDEYGCGVKATFTTKKGSLPRLRFGNQYRFRARIVDLAGNSLKVDSPVINGSEGASDKVGYWRFEPVDPPVIVHRTRVSEGESLERMVIRSNNVSAKAYLDTQVFKEAINKEASKDFDYAAANERHFVPPKSSVQQCETHGLFDAYYKDWQKIKEGYELAIKRESGTLFDDLKGSSVEVVTPNSLNGIATSKSAPSLPTNENPTGDRMAAGQYVIHREELITTPWLPDDASEGTAIRALSGIRIPGIFREVRLGPSCEILRIPNKEDEFVILISNSNAWPDNCGFRLVLEDIAAESTAPFNVNEFMDYIEPKWDEKGRTLTFFAPKGHILRLLYSSFVSKRHLESFGIPQWVMDKNQRAQVYSYMNKGLNWLITPFRDLTLVHATQAPVFGPIFNDLRIIRNPGSQDVKLTEKSIFLHGRTTGKFEIEANWSEWVDDITKDEPKRVSFNGQLGEIKLAENHRNMAWLEEAVNNQMYNSNDPNVQRADIHSLGDTRFRLVKYSIRGTTRFREYLPPSIYEDENQTVKLENVTKSGPVATGDSMVLPPNVNTDAGAPILDTCLDRTGRQSSNSQSRILSSAPPADPKVMYVLPTMRWHSNVTSDKFDISRYGNGLRVWLDRPWFSTGDGELLGVIIMQGESFNNISLANQSFITQWGKDPFWNSSSVQLMATEQNFPLRVAAETVRLQEKPDTSVTVVGHRVHYNKQRRLWYCDIQLDQLNTYMPFVRLALVRYQPNTLSDVSKISKVVLTDFAQVLPHRRAEVTLVPTSDSGTSVTASLRGPNPQCGPISAETNTETGKNRVELVLQTRDPLFDSDMAWVDTDIPLNSVISVKLPIQTEISKATITNEPIVNRVVLNDAKIVEKTIAEKTTFSTISQVGISQFDKDLYITPSVVGSIGQMNMPLPEIADSPFFNTSLTLHKANDNRPRRLMLREFECYYKHKSNDPTDKEERVVFACIIPLEKV